MKSKMSKYTFLIYHREYDDFLKALGAVGVLHVQERGAGIPENDSSLQRLLERKKSVEEAVAAMAAVIDQHREMPEDLPKSKWKTPDEIMAKLPQLQKAVLAQKAVYDHLVEIKEQVISKWGYVDWEAIDQLNSVGYRVDFCSAPALDPTWIEEYNLFEVGDADNRKLYMAVNPAGKDLAELPAEQVKLPRVTEESLQNEIKQAYDDYIERLTDEADLCITQYNTMEAYNQSLQSEIDFEQVRLQSSPEAENSLYLLEGWCPEEECPKLEQMLNGRGVYYSSRKATKADDAPVRMKNNAFVRMYEVLTKMYGFPTYGEWDPTPIVAPFFTLFFAICMGDAGYGLLLMLFGWGVHSGKIQGGMMDMFKGLGPMIMSLGVATAVVGFFLGTFFGISLVEAAWVPDGVKALIIHGEVFGYDIQMVGAICIGVFHICLAMVIKAVLYTRRFGFASQISTWGWLLLILGGIIVGIMAMCNLLSEQATKYVLIGIGAVSALGIYIFNDPKRNPLVNIGAGLWDTYNMVTGIMGDVLSYIRLYALCLAGGMLGGAFNTLGDMVLGDHSSLFLWIPAVLIYVLGHAVNLVMSSISAFVHPLRLTFVEYFKNSGYEGKGKMYKPFEIVENKIK